MIAHRTSPTNIGLALLANLAAYDFGYHLGRPAASTERAARFARWNSWSAITAISTTGTTRGRCAPLPPRYISTVDSGNLVGHLLMLGQGWPELADAADPARQRIRRPGRHDRSAARRGSSTAAAKAPAPAGAEH